jgi:sugar (pentulose or hexulose) kinase
VVCGIHDSNASYLRHLLTKRHSRFAVLSSGTWVVLMANKGDLSRLKPERDMLANVDAFGAAVATARFMGGREYEAIACTPVPGGVDELKRLMVQRAKALPAFALGGPFAHSPGRLVNAHALSETERASLATLYLALMSDLLMESLGVEGDVILDGPLADDPLFGSVLARLRPANRICAEQAGGAASAVCYLAGYPLEKGPALREIRPAAVDRLDRYRMRWREELPKLPSAARQLAS